MIGRNLLLSSVSILVLGLPAGIFFFKSVCCHSKSQARFSVTSAELALGKRVGMPHEIQISGQLEPVEAIDLSSGVLGIVSEIRFKPGDQVRAGTVIAVIRPTGSEDRLAAQRERIASAEKDLKAREREWAESEKDLVKRRELSRQDLIPRREVADAEVSVETAKAALELARAHLAQQQAMGAQAGAANALGQIRAPINGQVVRIIAHPGKVVREGSPILSLADSNRLKLVARLHGARANHLLVGAEARVGVAVASGSPTEIPGMVSRIDDEQDGVRVVEIELRTAAPDLRIGMGAEAKIDLLPGRGQ